MTDPITNWFGNLGDLLAHRLTENPETFFGKIEPVCKYVLAKSKGRCLAKPHLENATERELMISELFQIYCQNPNINTLCNTRLLRSFVWHDSQNNGNLIYFDKYLFPIQVEEMHLPYELIGNPGLRTWLCHFNATIQEPQKAAFQQSVVSTISPEDYKNFMKGQMHYVRLLIDASNNNWLSNDKIQNIIDGIQQHAPKIPFPHPLAQSSQDLTEETIVPYFISHYQEFLYKLPENQNAFRALLISGLTIFQKIPS